MDIKVILFDFDGTLVDSEALHYHSWMKVLAPFDINYSELEFCREFSGIPTLNSAEVLKKKHCLAPSSTFLAAQKNRLFVETADEIKPTLMAYAEEVLKLASDKFQLALVTGSTRSEALPVLEHYDLLKYFNAIVCKDDISYPKPHPEPYLHALTLTEQLAKQAIAIEDTSTGLSSAYAAQLRTIVVPNKHSQAQKFDKATYVEKDLFKAWQRIKLLTAI
ncbi:HAD family phosphatase [Pseudoalteromonas sp. MMG012]|uniref:HAD family hydrolase n=1 Tax=Pseudoalteromonas sp. MMG012 TaxID=2822686 RepID=UPI001B3A6DE1|nr:HAD family phosphatase [Pseudoalteromonas sp. MMG012]MBQ4848929.1 HAD family phosphatase [Pseudoalteromonas sp. MMG012]